MSRLLLVAWTPPISNPPYLSINYDHKNIEITVRSNGKEDGSLGDTVSVKLTKEEFTDIIDQINKKIKNIGKYKVDCINSDCDWSGWSTECVRWKNDTGNIYCPECYETVQER